MKKTNLISAVILVFVIIAVLFLSFGKITGKISYDIENKYSIFNGDNTVLYFAYDKNCQNRVTNIQEGDEIRICVFDPDENFDSDIRDKIYTDIKVFDQKTGAYIIWNETEDYLEETGADTGLFISSRSFQLGARENVATEITHTHVVDNANTDFKWGNYIYINGIRGWLGDSPISFTLGFMNIPIQGYLPSEPVAEEYLIGRFENMDTIVGIYQDPNDDRDTAVAMAKIIDTEAELYWDNEIYKDALSSAKITVVDPDENLDVNSIESVPVFIIVNPGSWNPVKANSSSNFCDLKHHGGIDPADGSALNKPIRWYNIYNSGLGTPYPVNSQPTSSGAYYIEYPTASDGNIVSFDTTDLNGYCRVMFYAQETGVNDGVFELNLNQIQMDLGFDFLNTYDALVAYYLDPNDFDDFKISAAYIETKEHVSHTSFTDSTRAEASEYNIGRDSIYVQVIDSNVNVDPCCPQQLTVHVCDLHEEDDSEWITLDEASSNSPVFFSNSGTELKSVWDPLGIGYSPANGGYQLELDNLNFEVFNEDSIYVRYNDVYYDNQDLEEIGDRDINTAFPPLINKIRLTKDVSFDLIEIADTQVYDGSSDIINMYFLDKYGNRISEINNTPCFFIEVYDPDQNEDSNKREKINAFWDGQQNLPLGPFNQPHPFNSLLGTSNTLNNNEFARIYVLNPRNSYWMPLDLYETGTDTGDYMNAVCIDLQDKNLNATINDTLIAVYTDPSNPSDNSWIYIKVSNLVAQVNHTPEQVLVHVCDLHEEDDSEWIILSETSVNSPAYFSNSGTELKSVWDPLGIGYSPANGGYHLELDNLNFEVFNEDSIYVRYNDVYYDINNISRIGDSNTSTAFPPFIDKIRFANDISFDLIEIADTQVYDGSSANMYFLDRNGNRVSGYINSDCAFIEVYDPDQNEDSNKREQINAFWDGQQNFPFGAFNQSHPFNSILGTNDIFSAREHARVYFLNPRNGLWAPVDLYETGASTGDFISKKCVDLASQYPGAVSLEILPGDTLIAVYTDPSNPSDNSWIQIKVSIGGMIGSPPPSEMYFAYDKRCLNNATDIQEGDEIWICVYDPDENFNCDVRDKIYTDIKVFDQKTGAYIIWDNETDYLDETGADTGLFVSKRIFQLGTREDTTNINKNTHVVDNANTDFKWGNYIYINGIRGWLGDSSISFTPGFMDVLTEGYLPSEPVAEEYLIGRFENMDTIVGIYQDPNDDRDTAVAMAKIIDTEAELYWDNEIYTDANNAATITVVDPDENLDVNSIEYVPVFIIVNPGSWNIDLSNNIPVNNFCDFKHHGGLDSLGSAIGEPIRWYNIYKQRYIKYPTASDGNIVSFGTSSTYNQIAFYAQETGVDEGVFELNLTSILSSLGFNSLNTQDVLAAYYLDPNDFDDFKISTAYIETDENISNTNFTNAIRQPASQYWLGRDAIYIQLHDDNCTDDDEDGYGVCPNCNTNHRCLYDGEDCNDTNPDINPGAVETCGDGIDYDCDGQDSNGYNIGQQCGSGNCIGTIVCDGLYASKCNSEGNDCGTCCKCDSLGTEQYDETQDADCPATQCPADTCYGTNECPVNIFSIYPDSVANTCQALFTCTSNNCIADCEEDADSDNYSPTCGDCNDNDDTIHPPDIDEQANGLCNGVDDDCDGTADENCACLEGDMQTCGTGICQGTQTCNSYGQWGACSTDEDDCGVCCKCLGGSKTYDENQDSDCNATICPEDGCGAGDCTEHIWGDFPVSVPNECEALEQCTANICIADCEADNDSDMWSISCGDCDDNTSSANPGADEICDDDIDNDCDGLVDTADPDCPEEKRRGGGGGGGCFDRWECSDWEPEQCPPSGIQTRTCEYTGTCQVKNGKPAEQQNCTYIPPTVEVALPEICEPQWSCVPIGECTPQGLIDYLCTDLNSCEPDYTEQRECVYEKPPEEKPAINLFWLILAIAVIVAIILFWILFYKHREDDEEEKKKKAKRRKPGKTRKKPKRKIIRRKPRKTPPAKGPAPKPPSGPRL